jgi:hypothetical protein
VQSKSSKTYDNEPLNIHAVFKEHLMKDFCSSLAVRIIEHNVKKHCIGSNNRQYYAKLINAIVSDYQAIQPLGHITVADLKKDLQAAVRQIGN